MTDSRRHTQLGAQEGGAEFGNEFLARIGVPAMAAREIPVQPRGMARPMPFMPISA